MQTIGIVEARANLSDLLLRVSEDSERILIGKRGKPYAMLVPLEDSTPAGRVEGFAPLIQQAVERASEVVLWIGPTAELIYSNETASRSLGYASDELSALKIFDIDQDVDADNWRRTWTRIKTESPYTFEARLLRKDGSGFPAEVSVYYLRDGGQEFACCFCRDISERKKTENALRESEARLRAILDHAPMEIYLKDADGRYLEINRHYEALWGVRNEEVRGKLPGDVHPDETFAEASSAHDLAVLESGEVIEREDEARTSDGLRLLHMTKFPIRDLDGEIRGLGAVAIDVTERRRAEGEVMEAERRFRDFAAMSSDWFWEMGPDLRFRWISEGYEQKLGMNPNPVIGKARWEIAAEEEKEDEEKWSKHRKDLQARRAFRNFQYKVKQENGEVSYRNVNGIPLFDEQGEFQGYRGTATDITARIEAEAALRKTRDELERRVEERTRELRESEQRFRDYAEAAADWFWEMDAELRFSYMSENVERLVGLPPEWHYGKTREDLLGPDYDRDAWDEHLRALHERRPFRSYEFPRKTDNGEVRWLRSSGRPSFSEDGTFLGYRGTGSDITEQKQAEERLRASEEQLRQSQKMQAVGQLTGGVAHDFNNLLAVINGNAEFLTDEVGRDNPMLEAIMNASARGSELTQRLLAFSRQQPLNTQAVDLAKLVDRMRDLLARSLGATVEIEAKAAPDLRLALADPGQVENALLNLSINARDAMPTGGKLTIECLNAHLDEDYVAQKPDAVVGDYALLVVSDSGQGMSAEVLVHAFEPFYSTKEAGMGSGLGLSMVYGFAKQSGGHLAIYSELGKGTTVKLYLPLADVAQPERRIAAPIEGVPRGRGEVLLIVEDDPDVRLVVVRFVVGLGYKVIEAPDAARAQAVLERGGKIDLVLSDVVLPGGKSGPELIDEVLPRFPGLKVVFMSGYPCEAARRNGFIGSDRVLLNKPFDKRELAAALRNALDDQVGKP